MQYRPSPVGAIARTLICVGTLAASYTAAAQGLVWGNFSSVGAFGGASTATNQSLPATVAGQGRGSGTATLNLNVSGGSNAWNGFGVAGNDDGYQSGPNMPVVGVTMVNGGPGYFGGIPLLSPISFVSGYNAAGGPVNVPAPTTDRNAIYFDAGDGTTTSAQWNFSGLVGGSLPAGSWLFIDNVDQGERITLTGPSGWIASVHTGDSTLPRPPQIGVPVMVSAPTFPTCAPAISLTSTSLELVGRYGDISTLTPTCSATPVPVSGQTVGYTKGVDGVGVWVQTAIDLVTVSVTAIDTDPSQSNGQGGFLGPDNNYFLGLGFISATAAAPVVGVPSTGMFALFMMIVALFAFGARQLLGRTSSQQCR